MLNMIPFAPEPLYRPAVEILARLHQAGHEAYIAGGAVRDHLLGRVQTDLDIATSATPSEVRALFPRTFAVGESFGVVVVRHRGRHFEVATFREEADYRDGRRPAHVLRFCSQLDFDLDPATLEAIRQEACHLPVVSWERIRIEVEKMLLAPAAGRGLALLDPTGLGPVLVEALRREARATIRGTELAYGGQQDWSWCVAVQMARQGSPLTDETGATQALLAFLLDVAGWTPVEYRTLPVTGMAHALEGLARALHLTRLQCATLRATASWLCGVQVLGAMRLADQLRLLRRPEARLLVPLLPQHPGWRDLDFPLMDNLILQHGLRWNPPPLLRGERLLELGIPGGRDVGRVLEALETEQLEGRLHDAAAAEVWLRCHPESNLETD